MGYSSSSSSSSSGSDWSKKKKKKDKHGKHSDKHGKHGDKPGKHGEKHGDKHGKHGDKHHEQYSAGPSFHLPGHDAKSHQAQHQGFPNVIPAQQPHAPNFGFPNVAGPQRGPVPPAMPSQGPAAPAAPPAAGHRIALSTETPFPAPASLPPTSLYDMGGAQQPVYVGSAIFESSVQPCKIAPHINPPVRVPYGGQEHEHRGRYDLLPIDETTMEWVTASHGRVPPGRRPIEGGYEQDGTRLFHAIAYVNGLWVPGKTGEHLGAANVPFAGEQRIPENYQILCWRY